MRLDEPKKAAKEIVVAIAIGLSVMMLVLVGTAIWSMEKTWADYVENGTEPAI